uniref:[histone H3]-trimethyl-L-lysine(4) demethylase n=1 Tax=Blastobotrys adeninivorans TaxID=409370 RepID=A0A060T5J9_BLAAD
MTLREIAGVGEVEIRPPPENQDSHKTERPFRLLEAPTFRPTKEEFKDPYEYIKSLAPAGQQYGIVKIIPPESWQPKFALDTGSFKFGTRRQTIKSMGAATRSTMEWIDRMARFHMLNGFTIEKYPRLVDGTMVNLFTVKRLVDLQQTIPELVQDHTAFWNAVCRRMQVDLVHASEVSRLYWTLVVPYERYCAHVRASPSFSKQQEGPKDPKDSQDSQDPQDALEQKEVKSDPDRAELNDMRDMKTEAKKESIRLKRSADSLISPPPEAPEEGIKARRRSSRLQSRAGTKSSENDDQGDDSGGSRARRKVSYAEDDVEEDEEEDEDEEDVAECPVCTKEIESKQRFFHCSECDEYYHGWCLGFDLSLVTVDQASALSNWYCPKCLVDTSQFYFDEGNQYTLSTFKEMADDFKDEYLSQNMPGYDTASRDKVECFIEEDFWRHVEDVRSALTVEYGADVKCDEQGSGFPLVAKDPYHKYARDQWNLNNFPQLKKSLFHYMRGDISGVTLPWAYVGMLFSAFCWHSEDHYTYSVNYQHFGDTKTWYGVPGSRASDFEAVCRNVAPDIFANQPDTLFQRATIVPPRRIIEHGVPCYVADQRAGQFIITFPKAYHCGLNQGFNFNEAVNYAPPEWIPFGRESVEHYRIQHRAPLFSLEELLVRVAQRSRTNDEVGDWLPRELQFMIDNEQRIRQATVKRFPGIEQIIDPADRSDEEEIQCTECNGLSYLSRLVLVDKKGRRLSTHCHHDASTVKLKPGYRFVLYARYTLEYLQKLLDDIDTQTQTGNEPQPVATAIQAN